MSIFALSCFIIGVLAGFTGLFVLLKGMKEKLNKSWFLLNLSILVWIEGLGATMVVADAISALFWQKVLYIGTIFIPVLFFHFCTILTEKEEQFRKLFKINLFVALVFLFSLLTNNWFMRGIKPRTDFGYWPTEIGWLYYPFLFWFAVNVIYSFLILKKYLRKKGIDSVKQRQVLIIFYGTAIGFIAGSLNFLLDFNIIFPPVHNFFVGSYLIFTALAITRYHLFGIRVILTELLVGVMGIILLFLPFVIETTLPMRALMIGVFLLFCFFGYLLIRYTYREIRQKEILEQKVKERTKELQTAYEEIKKRKEDLEKFYKLTVGRELRMIELKKKIKELEERVKGN